MKKSKKVMKGAFRILTGVVIGSAVGSILGLTLAPKKGDETRKYIKEQSMKVFLKSKEALKDEKMGPLKRLLIKMLTSKK